MSFERFRIYSSSDSGYYTRGKEKPRPLLTDEFAQQIFAVSQHLDDELPVASLIAYSEDKRKLFKNQIAREIAIRNGRAKNIPSSNLEQIENNALAIDALKLRLGRLDSLPLAPDIWADLFIPGSEIELDIPQKKVLMDAITGTLKIPNAKFTNKWVDSQNTVYNLRLIDDSSEFPQDPRLPRTRIFLAKAF